MTNAEAINWIINLSADIGKIEHQDLWHYEQALDEIRELLEDAQPEHKTGRWIPCSERLPEDNVPVNITWVNRDPEPYYAHIKDKPFTATGVYFRGKWYWYSSTVEDYLAEYGRAEWDEIEEAMHNSIEITAWMPLPEPYQEVEHEQ